MVKKVLHSGNLVKLLSLGGDSSQSFVNLVEPDPSGWFLDIQNPVWAHNVTLRGFLLNKIQSDVCCRRLKPPIETLSGSDFKVPVESKFMTLPSIFLNCRICFVWTQEDLPAFVGWKMNAFRLCLTNSGRLRFYVVRFSDGLTGCLSKCVSEQSQNQFCQS